MFLVSTLLLCPRKDLGSFLQRYQLTLHSANHCTEGLSVLLWRLQMYNTVCDATRFQHTLLSSLKGKMLMKGKSHVVRWAGVCVHALTDILQFLLPLLLLFSLFCSFFKWNSYQSKIMPALLRRHTAICNSLLLGDSV